MDIHPGDIVSKDAFITLHYKKEYGQAFHRDLKINMSNGHEFRDNNFSMMT